MIGGVRMNNLMKDLIVEKRDKEGLTFEQIADYFKEEYDLGISRQAIHGLYTRHKMGKRGVKVETEKKLDIINLCCLGYTNNKISEKVDVSNYKVASVISENSEEIEEIRNSLIQKVVEKIEEGDNYLSLKGAVEYKGVGITKTGEVGIVSSAIAKVLSKKIDDMMLDLRINGVPLDVLTKSIEKVKRDYTISVR